MKKIVIWGNSLAGVKAAEDIRAKDQESEITLLCDEPYLPGRRDFFPDFLAKKITEKDLLYRPEKFYSDQKILLVSDQKIERISFNRKYLTTETKERFSYDTLLINDSVDTKLPDIKGSNKKGVLGFRSRSEVSEIFASIPLVETIVVQSDQLEGLKVAWALRQRGKEVIFITPHERFLPNDLDGQASELLAEFMHKDGINFIPQSGIREILGNGDVKAVRIQSGKVLGCEMVIFADAGPSLKKVLDSSLEINQRIVVAESFESNLKDHFVLGEMGEMRNRENCHSRDFSLETLESQGRAVAKTLAGEQASYIPPDLETTFAVDGFSLYMTGISPVDQGCQEYVHFDQENRRYRKLFIKDQILAGALLVNMETLHQQVAGWVQEKAPRNVWEKELFPQSENQTQTQNSSCQA